MLFRSERERIAKSTLLAIAELTEVQHRKCYVILFSDDIESIDVYKRQEDAEDTEVYYFLFTIE